MEDDDLVDAIDELGAEVRAERVHHLAPSALVHSTIAKIGEVRTSKIRRHDDDGVLEIDRAPLPVGQAPVVEQLQQDVQHFRMRLLNLVEEHDGIRTAPHCLGQLSRLFVADVSRGRAEEARHRVLLLILGHVDANHRVLIVEQELGKRARELGLADAGRAQKDETAERAIRILQAGPCAANGVCHGANRLILSHDSLMQALFHMDELLDFAFHQAADGNVRPLADDIGDVFFVDLFLEHAQALFCRSRHTFFFGADLPLDLGQPAILQLGRFPVIAGALDALNLRPQPLELFLELALALNGFLLLLPPRHQRVVLLLEIGQLLLELLEPLLRGLVFLFPQRFALDLELHDAAVDLVELGRHRVDLHPQLRGRLVHEIDGFVGQETIGDVAMGQYRRRHECRVLDADAMMNLVALAKPAQDADGVFDGRLVDHHRLEPPLERCVFFDVLAVLVERRGADRVKLAAREHRLQHVRRVHRSFRRPGAHDGVQLVDEEDDLPL